MSIPKSEIVLASAFGIPEGIYGVEIIEVEVKFGKKENAKECLHAKCKIIAPESVEVGGEPRQVIGRQFFLMPNVTDPSVDYGLGRILEGLTVSGFDFSKFNEKGEIDLQRIHVLVGHKMQMHLSSYEDIRTRAATDEERRANPSSARVPLKDLKGKLISGGWKICAPKKSKGEYVSPSWQEVVGAYDGEGVL